MKLILKLGSWGDWSGLRQMTPYILNNTNKATLLSPDHAASRLVKKGSDLGTSLVFFKFGAPEIQKSLLQDMFSKISLVPRLSILFKKYILIAKNLPIKLTRGP